MSRNRSHRDPAADRAITTMLVEQFAQNLAAAIDSLDFESAALIVGAFKGQSLSVVADQIGISRRRAAEKLSKGMSKLRHPMRSMPLRDVFDMDDGFGALRRIESSALRDDHHLVHCDRHGWVEQTSTSTCRQCSCPVPVGVPGRPRQYCSDACRQQAYRHRHTSSRALPSADGIE